MQFYLNKAALECILWRRLMHRRVSRLTFPPSWRSSLCRVDRTHPTMPSSRVARRRAAACDVKASSAWLCRLPSAPTPSPRAWRCGATCRSRWRPRSCRGRGPARSGNTRCPGSVDRTREDEGRSTDETCRRWGYTLYGQIYMSLYVVGKRYTAARAAMRRIACTQSDAID